MRIAVLTLTRDRLDYTQHCFQTLQEFAGCDFDHYVLDQGSTDDTVDCLVGEYGKAHVTERRRDGETARGSACERENGSGHGSAHGSGTKKATPTETPT